MSARPTLPTHDVFLDLETGGLRDHDRFWEVGMVVDFPGREPELHHYYVYNFDTAHADPKALQMNGFYDRHPQHRMVEPGKPMDPHVALSMDDHGLINADPDAAPPTVHSGLMSEDVLARHLSFYLRGARLCVVNPAYDQPKIVESLHAIGLALTSYYTPVCIGSFAAGVLGIDPCGGSSSRIAEGLGLDRSTFGTEHSALVDSMYGKALLRTAEERAGVKPHWMRQHEENEIAFSETRAAADIHPED